MPKSGIAGSYGSSIFSFLRYRHTVFHYLPIIIPTNNRRVLFSPHPLQHLSFVNLLTAILTGVMWYLIEVLTCISLVISNFEHFFMCLFAICISSLEKCLFRSFCPFSIGLLVFLLLSCINCLYILEIKHMSVASFEIIFSHSIGCLLHTS
uniref:Uncharacterized protein n=1 Tax=Sus scrofa TaxID=9823 RepID=A0A8D1WNV7_PIG